MNNYETFRDLIKEYFCEKGISFELETSLHDASFNDNNRNQSFLYNGKKDLSVISMDCISKEGYRKLRGVEDVDKCLNTTDAFIINEKNEWYFIEFKDSTIGKSSKSITAKGMANFLLLLSILYEIGIDKCSGLIDLSNPMSFARNHFIYIVVCNSDKDEYTYEQVRNLDRVGEVYTPHCLYKFKEYLFKDAYVYTEDYFEQRFVKRFQYQREGD